MYQAFLPVFLRRLNSLKIFDNSRPLKVQIMIEKITLEEYLSEASIASSVYQLISMSASNELSKIAPINLCNQLFTGKILSNTDLNDVKSSGGHYVTTGVTNGLDYSYLLVFRISDEHIIQVNIKNSGAIAMLRSLYNNSWSEWRRLAFQS